MNKIFIVNPKGGSGKSTIAIHTAIGLLLLGYKVLLLDCDFDQLTSYNFCQNRNNFHNKLLKNNIVLPLLDYEKISIENLETYLNNIINDYNFIIVDTPGITLHHNTTMIINLADTIICPLNESFIDLNALKESLFFSQLCMLKNQPVKNSHHKRNITLVTNRRSFVQSHHQEEFYNYLQNLKKSYGLDFIQGFFESVSFKELFPKGLTTLDCNILNIVPSVTQKKSIDTIKIYIKYIIQKILINQNYYNQ